MNSLCLSMMNGAEASLPNGLFVVLVLIVGWSSAILIRWALSCVLERVRFNQLCEKAGFADFLRKGHFSYSPSKLIGVIAYWITVLLVLFWSAKLLNLGMAKTLSARLATSAPGFISAILILIIGMIAVSFIGNFVMTLARNAAFSHARLLSKTVKIVGWILVFSLTLDQANIGTTTITALFLIVMGAIAFGLALAFGLGCKDMARNAMERFLHELKEKSRTEKTGDLEG